MCAFRASPKKRNLLSFWTTGKEDLSASPDPRSPRWVVWKSWQFRPNYLAPGTRTRHKSLAALCPLLETRSRVRKNALFTTENWPFSTLTHDAQHPKIPMTFALLRWLFSPFGWENEERERPTREKNNKTLDDRAVTWTTLEAATFKTKNSREGVFKLRCTAEWKRKMNGAEWNWCKLSRSHYRWMQGCQPGEYFDVNGSVGWSSYMQLQGYCSLWFLNKLCKIH